jgi:hypothetical protein
VTKEEHKSLKEAMRHAYAEFIQRMAIVVSEIANERVYAKTARNETCGVLSEQPDGLEELMSQARKYHAEVLAICSSILASIPEKKDG